jgi:hypothetical protein
VNVRDEAERVLLEEAEYETWVRERAYWIAKIRARRRRKRARVEFLQKLTGYKRLKRWLRRFT